MDPHKEDVRRLRTMCSVSLRPYYVRAMGRKHVAGILVLLDLGMCTIMIGLQQSGMECLHREVLKKEINASVIETAPFVRKGEEISSRPIPAVIFVEQRSSNSMAYLLPFYFHTKAEFLDRSFCRRSWSGVGMHTTSQFVLLSLILRMKGM